MRTGRARPVVRGTLVAFGLSACGEVPAPVPVADLTSLQGAYIDGSLAPVGSPEAVAVQAAVPLAPPTPAAAPKAPAASMDVPLWSPPLAPETRLAAPKAEAGYVGTSFDVLASYDPSVAALAPPSEDGSAPDPMAGIPESVRLLHGQKVGLAGFMIPIEFEGNAVRAFMLCRYQQGCCFGHVPQIHEWVYVSTRPETPARFVIVPLTVYGTLDIGRRFEEGNQAGVYRMTADKITIPEDW